MTVRDVAGSLGMTVEEVEGFYKLGLRARSYILMSMHAIISFQAAKYSAAFGMDKAVGG